MRRILTSLLVIGVVAATAISASRAFFSDTETSEGNILSAGSIDLKISNTSRASNPHEGEAELSTWEFADLTDEKFFNFVDLKPGDWEIDTIGIDIVDNDAWMCANIQITQNSDNGFSEPEDEMFGTSTDQNDGTSVGDLAAALKFRFWKEVGAPNNRFDAGEVIFMQGTVADILGGATYALADSQAGIFGGPMDGDTEYYIGKAFCYGEWTTNNTENSPGFGCDGQSVSNLSQTDLVMGNISFYATQSRNNDGFLCSSVEWPTQEVVTVGANLTAYQVPTSECDVIVDGSNIPTIAAGIAAASNGDTVCVNAGTYNENVVVNKSIRLAGDGASATSTINGQGTGQNVAVKISANNVIFEGFNVVGSGIAAIWTDTGVSGATVRYNKFTSAAGATALTTQGIQGNSTFANNEFVGNGASQLAYVNGAASLGAGQASDSVDFLNNTFSGTIVPGGVVLGIESSSSDVKMNVFESTLTSTYAIAETWEWSVVFNQNNFNGVGGVKVKNSNASQANAENNWWGDTSPADNVTGPVDYTPFAMSAFAEY